MTLTTEEIRSRHAQYVTEAGGVVEREATRNAEFDAWLAEGARFPASVREIAERALWDNDAEPTVEEAAMLARAILGQLHETPSGKGGES